MSRWLRHVRRVNARNVEVLRNSPLAEISGSLGDLGTLLPLMIALATQNSIKLGSTLVFSGLFNVLTGAAFGIPLPVQPMKAIASAAISGREDSSMGVVLAAGQWVSAIILVMSVTGLLRWFVRVIPLPVVKGVQLGAGLSLVIGAGSSLLKPLHWIQPVLDNRLWAIVAFLALVCTQRLPRFPYALSFFILALIFATIGVVTSGHTLPAFHIWRPSITIPTWIGGHDAPALWMAIGQLPLTTLNSIIAVCQLSEELIPEVRAPSVTAMGLSVAAMNLTGGWFGAMPVCHGSGGLAAQYRFGARSGASIMMLGALKIILGILFGETIVGLLDHYPRSLLGIMVFAAGLELAKVGNSLNDGAPDLWEVAAGQAGGRTHRKLTQEERMQRWTVMLTTTGGLLAFRNDALGFLAGMLCHGAYKLSDQIEKRTARWREQPEEGDPLLQRH